MKPSLKIGNTADITITVTEDMCPIFDNVIIHRVYSTWSMANHMEIAARKVLKDHLEDHEEGIGSHLEINHLAPTPIGHQIHVVAEAVKLEATTLVCNITTYHLKPDGQRKIVGTGSQTQRILPKKILTKLIQKAST